MCATNFIPHNHDGITSSSKAVKRKSERQKNKLGRADLKKVADRKAVTRHAKGKIQKKVERRKGKIKKNEEVSHHQKDIIHHAVQILPGNA